ncbi:hypothetical protein DFH09DRAFT_1454191 [Mycena vulgaris]|nr:hypothetical protein DFH09DRAFT_1454191 [Mycena vulgaris]
MSLLPLRCRSPPAPPPALPDTFAAVAAGARCELKRQAALLVGLDADLLVIAWRARISSGEEGHGEAGDWELCVGGKEAADNLRKRFIDTEQALAQLREGTDSVRATIVATRQREIVLPPRISPGDDARHPRDDLHPNLGTPASSAPNCVPGAVDVRIMILALPETYAPVLLKNSRQLSSTAAVPENSHVPL